MSLCLIIFQYECPKDKNILTRTHSMDIKYAGDIRDAGLIPGWGRSLEESMATHSIISLWRIPWKEETGGLRSTVSQSQTGLKRLSTHAYWTSTLVYNSYSSSVNYLSSLLQSKSFSSSVCQLESHIAVHYLFSSVAFLCFCTICLCAIFWRIQASNFRELVSLNFRFLWCFLLIRFWL